MIECPECNGKGKVKVATYRDDAGVEHKTFKLSYHDRLCSLKSKLRKVGAWFQENWPAFLVVTLIVSIILFIWWVTCSIDASDKRQDAIKAKQDYLIVQYDDANQVQRCYLSPTKDGDVVIVGKGTIVWLSDIEHPGAAPASVGVSDLSKCIRYK